MRVVHSQDRCSAYPRPRNRPIVSAVPQRIEIAKVCTPGPGLYLRAMLNDLLRRMTAPEPRPLDDLDQRTALAALMVRIARSDGDYAPAEADRIDRILARRYRLTAEQAPSVRAEAERLEGEAPDTHRFTQAIKDTVPYEAREGVIEALWEVALADGERDHEEDSLLRLLANLLGVADRDSALARKRVERRGSEPGEGEPGDGEPEDGTGGPWGGGGR